MGTKPVKSVLVGILICGITALGAPIQQQQAAVIRKAAGAAGDAIEFVGKTEGNISVTASPAVTCPTTQTGDIVIAAMMTGTHDASGTPPTGWAKIGADIDGAGLSMSAFWTRADTTNEDVTFTNIFAAAENGIFVVVVYRNCLASGDPIDVTKPETSATSTAKDIAEVTVTANAMAIGIIGFPNGGASAFTVTWDGGLTDRVSHATTPDGYSDAGNNQIAVADIINATPDSQNIGGDLGTTAAAAELFVALKPE